MTVTNKNLEKDLKEGKLNSIYVFYGEEKYLKEVYLKKIKKIFGKLSLGINYILLDENNINSLISDIETPAFGFDKKLIVIRNSNFFKKDTKSPMKEKFKNYILENMDIIEESCVIIFIEQIVHKMGLFKTLEKKAIFVETKKMSPADIKIILKRICVRYKVNVDDRSLDHLLEVAGTDMTTLVNEIRKLIEYTGEGGSIKEEDIDDLCIKDIQAIIFDLTDYLGEKNIEGAIEVLDNLVYNKEPLQKIIITLYNHFKKVYFVKLAILKKRNINEVLCLKPNQVFLISKYRKQAEYFELRDIKTILDELIELDWQYKAGLIDLEIGLKVLLCKNC